jgi:peroxiredoxin
MANNLTGDYDAVIEISVRQINGLLGTLHQRRIVPGDSPSFPHCSRVRFGDLPGIWQAGMVKLASWVQTLATVRAPSGGQTLFSFPAKPAPGLALLYEKAAADLRGSLLEPAPTGRPRGRADVQVAAPTITFAEGATAEVTVHVEIRAHCFPDPGAANLPEPIHGEVQITYTAHAKTVGDHAVLHVDVPTDDRKILFIPKPGTISAAPDVEAITARVRKAVRGDFKPLEVDLPAGFPFVDFKALSSGATQVVALPLPLPNGNFPTGAIGSVNNQFNAGSEFAIAVSREYAQKSFDTVIAKIKTAVAAIREESFFADYTASVANIGTMWKAGGIDLSGKVNLHTGVWLAPDGWITFTQTFTLVLDAASQNVIIQAVGDPQVDESWWIPHSRALNTVRQARDNALVSAAGMLTPTFNDARNRLSAGLQTFDRFALALYTAVEVTPDGIIVRGTIRSSDRLDPVVQFEEISGGAQLSAFQSWIPGGGIDEFTWSWLEMKHAIPWANKPESTTRTHDFVLTKPASMKTANKICLHIDGHRTNADGFVNPVSAANDSCAVSSHEPILIFPPWLIKIMIPHWAPRPPEDGLLEQAITAHVNVAGLPRTAEPLTMNVLVHFVGARGEQPLEALGQAVRLSRRAEMPLVMVLVLPVGAFAQRPGEVEARLGSLGEEFAGRLFVTEDYLGGWSQAFAARETPGTYLMNARGEFVWQQQGPPEIESMAVALRQNLLPAPAPSATPLRLNVAPGDFALDVELTDEREHRTALRRLRGREVRLVFWQAWSAPCLQELRRLQSQCGENAPLIFAINGGEDRSVFAEVREKYGLSFPLIVDSDQDIATRYGVLCWPTTISINREGIVSRVQFGLTHEHRPPPREEAATAS